MRYNALLAADNHEVPAIHAPNAAAGPHIHIVDLFRSQLFRAPNIVNVIGVAAIDYNVARLQ